MLQRGGDGLLSPASVRRMIQDHITPQQKAASPFFPGFWDTTGWGYGGAVVTSRADGGPHPGSYGWTGGFGTSFAIDPEAGVITILLTQRLMRGADDTAIAEAFRQMTH